MGDRVKICIPSPKSGPTVAESLAQCRAEILLNPHNEMLALHLPLP